MEKAGEGVLADFLARVAALQPAQRTSARCVAILTKVSSLDVQSKLMRMPMSELRAILKRAADTLRE